MQRFRDALNDDLQFPKAMALGVGNPEVVAARPGQEGDAAGLRREPWSEAWRVAAQGRKIPAAVEQLARERLAARQAKDWAESDRLRDAIARSGYAVEDGAGTIGC
jgi:cysteinyl-tRNA synthetase